MEQSNRRKKVPRADKRVRDTPTPLLGIPQELLTQATEYYRICRVPSADPHELCDGCFSLSEPLGALRS